MEKYFDINEAGHSIRCKEYFEGNRRDVTHWVVACSGFGGNRDNHAVARFAERITGKYRGYGVVTFDWPCHGKDARNRFILSECLEYLKLVNRHVKEVLGAEKIYNYSASMGAYLTLLLIHGSGDPYERIAFRCAAVKLYQAMYDRLTEEEKEKLEKKGEVKIGYDRKIPITREFLEDLRENDITEYEYFDDADRILMLHGTKDSVVPIRDAEEFADANVIELIPVENADHPFSNPDSMDFAIQKIIAFFAPGQ